MLEHIRTDAKILIQSKTFSVRAEQMEQTISLRLGIRPKTPNLLTNIGCELSHVWIQFEF